jgi:hypothetical protein
MKDATETGIYVKTGRITRATANKALDYLQNIEEQLNLVL